MLHYWEVICLGFHKDIQPLKSKSPWVPYTLCLRLKFSLNNQPQRTAGLKPRYDFIVIGSGSAGCAVAARLALSTASVLLVEAGGEAQRSGKTQRARQAFSCWQSETGMGYGLWGYFCGDMGISMG